MSQPTPPLRYASRERPSVAVLIPALNEEAALPGVLEAMPAGVGPVVVADNGSTDATAEVARAAGALVVTETERGYGAACLAGIQHLARLPTAPDVLVFLDGDQSDDPHEIPRLVEPIVRGEADLVIGVRTDATGRQASVPIHARLGNGLVQGLARLLFGVRLTDLGPFRAVRFASLDRLAMDDRNWGWTLQMQLRAHRRGLRVLETPVGHRPRAAGKSKVSGTLRGSVMAGGKMLFTLVRERFKPRTGRS